MVNGGCVGVKTGRKQHYNRAQIKGMGDDGSYTMVRIMSDVSQRGPAPHVKSARTTDAILRRECHLSTSLPLSHRQRAAVAAMLTCPSYQPHPQVLAHEDPGASYNWLDTEGRATGIVFFRYFLSTVKVEQASTKLVKFSEL